MPLSPETLTRHELNGLRAEVVDASNPDLVGIAGRVVVETMRTLHLDNGSRVRQVPKRGATFQFALPASGRPDADCPPAPTDEAAADREAAGTASERGSNADQREDAAHVTVDGARLLSRPALRTENVGDSPWR